jgi:hypothetical protein
MTLGSHQRTIGKSQSHITPRHIIGALGAFDLDPCASTPQPWPCAAHAFTESDDGLAHEWFGRVWLNPPFDRRLVGAFIERLAEHGRGTAFVHARTETAWFRPIWSDGTALLFLAGRVIFHKADGSLQTTKRGLVANSGAPVVLCAFGRDDADILAVCGIEGAFVPLRLSRSVIVAAVEPSWREAVDEFLRGQSGPVSLGDLYRAFARHPKARGKRFWREKLRQTLQRGDFVRVRPGVYAAVAA